MNRTPLSSHHTFDDPRWYSFERNSRIPYGTFRETLGERIERAGHALVGPALTAIAIVIVVGLAIGWIR